jgi:AcrR family transcriptional regulator
VAPRPGVTAAAVVDAAIAISDRVGLDGLTLTAVARKLGVQTPSLFAHVAGRPGLLKALRLRSFEAQVDLFRAAATGRARGDAVAAVARAYRSFVRQHPGLYDASVPTHMADSGETRAVAESLLRATLDVIQGFGISPEESVHAARFLRSVVHGFLGLERAGGFGLPEDVDASFDRTVRTLTETLARWPGTRRVARPGRTRRIARRRAVA